MQWLSIIHPNLLPMSSPIEMDVPSSSTTISMEYDPGGLGIGKLQRPETVWKSFTDSHIALPREIISEIFVKACYVENAADSTYEMTTLAPLRLSQVSKFWREVATSTPRLWTHLHVVARRADINSALQLIKQWVPRCKHRPLKIDVEFKNKIGPFMLYPEDSLNLFRVVTKAAALLRRDMGYELDNAYFETHVKAGSSGVVPLVEERYLWYYGVNEAPSRKDIPSIPLLVRGVRRSVDEFGFGHYDSLSNSLTRLELQDTNGTTCLSTTELLTILAEFPQLRYISALVDHGDTTPPLNQVIAANLTTFKLSWEYTTDPGILFEALHAPKIEEMELSGDIAAGGEWNHLLHFIENRRPPIRTLALEDFDATASVTRLADCLAMCDTLESLWLEDCIVDDEFIANIGRRSPKAEDSVLSRLRIFGIVSSEDITGDCLVQTLRNADTEKLKEIFVFDCNGVLQEHCDAIVEQYKGTAAVDTIIVTPGESFY